MAVIEGGAFNCTEGNFTTFSTEEWNAHCKEHLVHTESGTTLCVGCKAPIQYSNVPYHPYDSKGSKNINLKCEVCDARATGNIRRIEKPTA